MADMAEANPGETVANSGSTFLYDAFISYSRSDEEIASRVERRLRSFSVPPDFERGKLRVFRDRTDLVGNDYVESITAGLRGAQSLVVLCSPKACASTFVGDEIQRFVEHHGSKRVFPVLIAGRPNHEVGPEDPAKAFPPELYHVFADPRGVDLRPNPANKDALAFEWEALLAQLLDSTPAVVGQRVARQRAKRFRSIALVASVVAATFLGVAVYALAQRARADHEAEVAKSRQLAATAQSLSIELLDASLALAAEAFRSEPTTQARDALLTVLTRSPRAVGFLHGIEQPTAVAVSEDGRWAAGGDNDGTLVLWELRTLVGHPLQSDAVESVESMSFAPDSSTLVVIHRSVLGAGSAVAEAWDVASGDRLSQLSLDFPLDDVVAVDDHTAILAGGPEDEGPGVLIAWDWRAETSREVAVAEKAALVVPVLGSRLLVALGRFPRTNKLVLVDGATLAPLTSPLLLDEGSFSDLDISPDGSLAAAVSGTHILLVDATTGALIRSERLANQGFAVQFVQGGSQLAVMQEDETVGFYSAVDLSVAGPPLVAPVTVRGLAATTAGSLLATGREAGAGVALWDLSTGWVAGNGSFGRRVAGITLSDLAFSADGSLVAAVGQRSFVAVWDVESGRVLMELSVFDDPDLFAHSVAFSPDGSTLLVGGGNFLSGVGRLVLLDPRTGEVTNRIDVGAHAVRDLSFSPDGSLLAVLARDLLRREGSVVVVDLGVSPPIQTVVDLTPAADLAFLPSGELVWIRRDLVTSSFVRMDPRVGRETTETEVEGLGGVFTPTGRGAEVLATLDDNRVAIVDLDVPGGDPQVLGSHRTSVASVTVSGDGSTAVTTDYAGEVAFWSVDDRRRLTTAVPMGPREGVTALFNPGPGRAEVLLFGLDGAAVVDGDPESWPRRACALANRGLTEAEWERFVGGPGRGGQACGDAR